MEAHGAVQAELRTLLRQVKSLAARYYDLTGKPLGATGEIAEFEAADKLNLVLSEARTPFFDAWCERDGKLETFQIKGRALRSSRRYVGSVPSIKCDGDFDWVLVVLLDQSTYDAVEIWRAARERVLECIERPGSRARNERKSLTIRQFKSIATKVWPIEPLMVE